MSVVLQALPRKFRLFILLAALGLIHPAPLAAQGIKSMIDSLGGGPKSTSPELSPAEQLDWVKSRIDQTKNDQKSEQAIRTRLEEAGLSAQRLEDFRAATTEILRNYQLASEVLSAVSATNPDAQKSSLPSPPSTEAQASALRDSLRRASIAEQSATGELELLRRFISQNQALLENSEREVRQLKEEAELAKTPEAKARATIQLDLAGLQIRAAESAVFLGKWRVAQQELLAKKASLEQDALRSALRAGGFDRQIDSRRAQSQLAAIELEEGTAEKEIAQAIKEQNRATGELAELRKQEDSAAAKTRIAAATALDEAAQRLVSALQAGVYLRADDKAHWTAIKALSDTPTAEDVRAAIARSGEIIARQKELRPSVDRRLLEAREGLNATQKQLLAGTSDPATKSLLERTVTLAQKRVDTLGSLVSKADQSISMHEEFLAELQAVLGRESASRKVSRIWEDVSHRISNIWKLELFSAGGNPITIGKVSLAGFGLLLAFLTAGWISRWTSRTATGRFQLADDQKTLLETSVFIPSLVILVLTVLYWLNIPLTVFAFLGGALAIGIGFGAQNLMNNFISGIILLMERQIKVGDIIEVAGSTGKVTHLGSRCSRIRKFNGVELLVPNSAFLEKEVTNWTLADPHHRFDFSVGVAYGSPVEKVMSLLNSALERQPEVLREPAASVCLEEFGDSAMIFRLYYWLELGGSVDSRAVGSELRCRIERDLRAAGIGMPYPQRDLHLKSSSPIAVRVEPATSPPVQNA